MRVSRFGPCHQTYSRWKRQGFPFVGGLLWRPYIPRHLPLTENDWTAPFPKAVSKDGFVLLGEFPMSITDSPFAGGVSVKMAGSIIPDPLELAAFSFAGKAGLDHCFRFQSHLPSVCLWLFFRCLLRCLLCGRRLISESFRRVSELPAGICFLPAPNKKGPATASPEEREKENPE